MPTHEIIDNRKELLVDHINRILSSTEAARFAVGYFFLSGLTSVAGKLNCGYDCTRWGYNRQYGIMQDRNVRMTR